MYLCKDCSSKAEVVDKDIKKSCQCKCGVVMDMGTTHLIGTGGISTPSNWDKALELINSMLGKK